MQPFDTDLDAQNAYSSAFEAISGPDRVARAVEMAEEAKSVALAGIRFRNPEFTDLEVHARWIRLLHGEALERALLSNAI